MAEEAVRADEFAPPFLLLPDDERCEAAEIVEEADFLAAVVFFAAVEVRFPAPDFFAVDVFFRVVEDFPDDANVIPPQIS